MAEKGYLRFFMKMAGNRELDFYYKNYKRLNETARDYYSQLSYFIKNMQRNDVVCEWVSDEILIHRDDLINQAFTSENEESFLKGIKRQSFREVKASMPEKFFLLVSDIKKLLKESSGYIVLFDFLYTEYTQEIDNVNDTYGYRGNVPSDVLSLHGYVNLIQSGQIESIVLESDKSDNLLIKYLESQKGIEKISKKGIEQAEILDGYDAGYLSQDGVFYGMRGTIANMLHLEIANEMYKKGLIPIKYKDEIDLFFEENGWAKIHGNRVLYAGYDLHTSGLTVIPMSLKQQKIIADYIEKLHDGIMEVNGFETITALKFKSTEQPMLRNYFSQIHI